MARGPKRVRSHVNSTKGANFLRSTIPPSWILHEYREDEDYGIDFMVEVCAENDTPTGARFNVQLKSRESVGIVGDCVQDRCKVDSLCYWLRQNDPSIYVVYEVASDRAWWESVRKYAGWLQKNRPNWEKQRTVGFRLPCSNEFTRVLVERLPEMFEEELGRFRAARQDLFQLCVKQADPEAPRPDRELAESMLALPSVVGQVARALAPMSPTAAPVGLRFFSDDSVLVQLPDNSWGVIDAGPSGRGRKSAVLEFLLQKDVQSLRFVCATHAHYDHIAGLADILDCFQTRIAEFWDNGVVPGGKVGRNLYERVCRGVKEGWLGYRRLSGGDHWILGSVQVRSFGPSLAALVQGMSGAPGLVRRDENLFSVVLSFEYGKSRVILGSDMPTGGWRDILELAERYNWPLSAQVVKVPHHGSRAANPRSLWTYLTQGCRSLALWTRPKSVYGLPHEDVLRMIESMSAQPVEVGDAHAHVQVYADGHVTVMKQQ